VETVNRNLGQRTLTGAVFLHVAKVFDNVWVEGIFYKFTVLNFPPYLVKTISAYLQSRTFQATLQSPTFTCRGHASWCRTGWNCFPCAVQPVCKLHADAVSPRPAGSLSGRHGSRGHVPQPLPSELPGGLPLQARALATGMEDLYQCL
jgi:hypothetical protein